MESPATNSSEFEIIDFSTTSTPSQTLKSISPIETPMPKKQNLDSQMQTFSNVFDLCNDPIPNSPEPVADSETAPKSDPKQSISMTLKTDFSKLSKSDYQNPQCKIPVMVSIETQETGHASPSRGLDLVVAVDVSPSMEGSKIKLVRETLNFIIQELQTRDRICVIKFDQEAVQLCGFKSLTGRNKAKLKTLLDDQLKVGEYTNIRDAVRVAYSALLSRADQNNNTAVLLLSDGQDTCGNSAHAIRSEMALGLARMNARGFKFQTHSFGYGKHHDERVLSMISDTASGLFYYVKDDHHVDECVLDCLGYLMSVIASQVRVDLTLRKGFSFEHLFSMLWTRNGARQARLKLHSLAMGKTVDYVTEVAINKEELAFATGQEVSVGKALMTCMRNEREITFEHELKVTFVGKNDQKPQPDPAVREAYIKAQGSRVLTQAKKLYDKRNYAKSKLMIEDFHIGLRDDCFTSGGFKSQMARTVKLDHVKNPKDFIQVNRVMSENVNSPLYPAFRKMNAKQRALTDKRQKLG